MIERPDADIQLMESLFDSSIPELLDINVQAQKGFTKAYIEGHFREEYMDLELTPAFLRNSDRSIINTTQQREIGNEVLAGLHEAWCGSDIYEHNPRPGFIEKYWEFVDDNFVSFTVVEMHGNFGITEGPHIRAYIILGKRPKSYQDILNDQESTHKTESKYDHDLEPVKPQPKLGRKIGGAVTRWWKNQANQPPQPGRL